MHLSLYFDNVLQYVACRNLRVNIKMMASHYFDLSLFFNMSKQFLAPGGLRLKPPGAKNCLDILKKTLSAGCVLSDFI